MNKKIYTIRIELEEIKPPIWRNVQLPSDIKLNKLHEVIQISMGWTNSHLHQFEKNGVRYSDPEFDDGYDSLEFEDEYLIKLNQLLINPKDKLYYEYDFGDSWYHKTTLQKIIDLDISKKKAICIAGKRACPPEDVGGVGGYFHFLECIKNPENEEHDSYLEWIGGEFNPEEFDVDDCNRFLNKLKLTKTNEDHLYNIMMERFD